VKVTSWLVDDMVLLNEHGLVAAAENRRI